MNLKKNKDPLEIKENEYFQGIVHRIIFSNEENSFGVISVTDENSGSEEVAIGTLAMLSPGETVKFYGKWVNNIKFGRQFKCDYHEIVYPGTEKGIINFLSSGFISGIGDTYAKRIVERFGMETINILSKDPERLGEVPGIGKKRLSDIKESWEKHRSIRDVMLFLQSYDISAAYAARIYRTYHHNAVERIKENPYCLAMDVTGIGFIMADAIAAKMGFPKNSLKRAESGIIYLLTKIKDQGHTFYPVEKLSRNASKDLNIPIDSIPKALENLISVDWIKIVDVSTGEKGVYLTNVYVAERTISRDIKRVNSKEIFLKGIDVEKTIKEIEGLNKIVLSEGQYTALSSALKEKILIITGGPGTGKTTIIKNIVQAFQRYGGKISLAAPTGRASKRLSQAALMEAKTIHRLLEYNPHTNSFMRHIDNVLDCDVLIIDEASMIDILLMYHLMQSVGPRTSVIFVGDSDQLPSVGPGNVLKDMISSAKLPVVSLKHIFRQKKGSEITLNAHNINRGRMIINSKEKPEDRNFFFIKKNDPHEIRKTIEELVTTRIKKTFGFNTLSDIQIITPMHKGIVGVEQLNKTLQNILNPNEEGIERKNFIFKEKDKVMQVVNNYDKEVFNGDIGFIDRIEKNEGLVIVDFDGKKVVYEIFELDELVLAYAITVHKSQGSEYLCVIMPLTNQHFIMLQRNLLYTAVTRGKQLVILVGDEDALKYAIENDKMMRRFTDLRGKIIESFESVGKSD